MLIYSGYVGGSVSGLTSFFSGIMKGGYGIPSISLTHAGVGAGGRVFYLLDRQSKIPLGVGKELSASRNGPIKFDNVRFTYPSRPEVEVLKGINLEIRPGQSVALVGTSGSGKSSILSLLDRFYDPQHGSISFDGSDIKSFTPESWRDRIGVVFQDPILFEGTVHDNIAYGSPHATRVEVEEAARKANCDFIWDLPQGFDTMSEQHKMAALTVQSARRACPVASASASLSRVRSYATRPFSYLTRRRRRSTRARRTPSTAPSTTSSTSRTSRSCSPRTD